MLDRRFVHAVTTARCGSFTVAAERVGRTQSAVTKSVADLERQLGFPIFTRTARGVIPTEEGRKFIESASRLINEAQMLLRGAYTGSDPYGVVLKIGVCPAAVDFLLADPAALLVTRHPGLRLDITSDSFEQTVKKLRSGTIDVAFGYEDAFSQEADFDCETMPSIATALYVRRGHPILELETMTLADIAQYELISPTESRPYDIFMRQIYEHSDIDAQTKIHFIDSFPIVAKMVAKTNAIAIAALEYTKTPSFRRRFVRVPFLESQVPSPFCCATRLRAPRRPATRAFIKACHEGIRPTAHDSVEDNELLRTLMSASR